MADSWLTDGNCQECRRKNYCKTECKKHRASVKRYMYNTMMSVTGMDKILDIMSTGSYNAHKTFETVARIEGMLED